MSFCQGLRKVAEDMSAEAKITATAPFQDAVPGTSLRGKAETGQARGRATRSGGVANENREFNALLRHNAESARFGGGKKGGE